MNELRVAVMNPDAVSEAKVFTESVHYFDSKRNEHLVFPENILVEVGSWTAMGQELGKGDTLSTYQAAVMLGHETFTHWLPTGDQDNHVRKLLISSSQTLDQGLQSLSSLEEAQRIAEDINELLFEAVRISQRRDRD